MGAKCSEAALEVVTGVFQRLCGEIELGDLSLVYKCLIEEISSCIKDGCLVHLNRLLSLLTSTVAHFNRRKVYGVGSKLDNEMPTTCLNVVLKEISSSSCQFTREDILAAFLNKFEEPFEVLLNQGKQVRYYYLIINAPCVLVKARCSILTISCHFWHV